MTKVMIGSARSDENKKAHGGKAGDQTGNEVSMQEWYLHGKGWRTFRPKRAAAAARIAEEMRAACENSAVGYDQYQRNTLYEAAARVNFEISRVQTPCETDCSALVRVCCAAAGIALPESVSTANLASALLSTGAFDEITDEDCNLRGNGLRAGDIQVTRSKGHTVVVVTGSGSVLKRGMTGSAVREMQQNLIALGYSVGDAGADGDFGANTELAVKRFQAQQGLTVDGICGDATARALEQAQSNVERKASIIGDRVHVRCGPGTQYDALGVVRKGDRLPAPDESGWMFVLYEGKPGFVSRKYAAIGEIGDGTEEGGN